VAEQRDRADLSRRVSACPEKRGGVAARHAGEQQRFRAALLSVSQPEWFVERSPAFGRPPPVIGVGAAAKPRPLRLHHGTMRERGRRRIALGEPARFQHGVEALDRSRRRALDPRGPLRVSARPGELGEVGIRTHAARVQACDRAAG